MGESRYPELVLDGRIGDFARLHIDAVELNDLIEAHGVGCEFRQAVWCPCARPETGRRRTGCPYCKGFRWIYPKELRQEIVALVTSRHPKRDKVPVGELVTGMCVITFPLGIIPAVGDLVLPEGEYHVVHETLFRAQAQIDNIDQLQRAKKATDLNPPKIEPEAERLLYPSICEIDYIHWIGEERLAVASAADYELVEGNRIAWRPGRGPDPGRAYTVRYRAQAAYILNPGEPLYRRENGGAPYPYRAEGARLDRWANPSLQGDD